MDDSGQANLTFDFGHGRHGDVECSGQDKLWVAVGNGFSTTDLWLKDGDQMIDLRVRVSRTASGIEVAVDRGDDKMAWWAGAAIPRLSISINVAAAVAVAAASAGLGQDFQEVVLGQTAI